MPWVPPLPTKWPDPEVLPEALERRFRWAFLGEALEPPEWPSLSEPGEAGLEALKCSRCGDVIGWLPPGTRPETILCAPCSVDEEDLNYLQQALARLDGLKVLWWQIPEQLDRELFFALVEAVLCAETDHGGAGRHLLENVWAAIKSGARHLDRDQPECEKELRRANKI